MGLSGDISGQHRQDGGRRGGNDSVDRSRLPRSPIVSNPEVVPTWCSGITPGIRPTVHFSPLAASPLLFRPISHVFSRRAPAPVRPRTPPRQRRKIDEPPLLRPE